MLYFINLVVIYNFWAIAATALQSDIKVPTVLGTIQKKQNKTPTTHKNKRAVHSEPIFKFRIVLHFACIDPFIVKIVNCISMRKVIYPSCILL